MFKGLRYYLLLFTPAISPLSEYGQLEVYYVCQGKDMGQDSL